MISSKKKSAKYSPFHSHLFSYLAFVVLFVFAAQPLQAQLQKTSPRLSYEHKSLKVNFTESENQFVVEFEKNFDYSVIVKKYDLMCVYRPLADSALYHVHMAAKPIVFMGDTKKIRNLGFENISDLTNALRKQEGVVAAYPMVLAEDGTPQAYTNKVIIKVKQAFDNRNTQIILNDLGIQPDSWQPLLVPNSYAVLTQKNISAIDLTKRLEKNAFIEYAEPDFILFLKRLSDPLYPKQWSLNNLGAASHPNGIPDADIDAPEAWTITKGNSNIKVAVLDEGVELNHPDLVANMLTGFDATGLGSAGQCNSSDSHGTACAGIIAAVDSNDIGIRGIAPRCKIVPVRIAYSGGGGGWVTSDNTIANAITWAYTTGNADILSNSWGGGSPSNLIINAIENAVSLGRNGLGSVVLFASGNSNYNSAAYPSSLPAVIAVTSTSMCNERKSPTSCDGESFWGANYGNDLDIAAPGVKITTTDNIGSGGYNTSSDYHATFNGTSSACPHAAGVMALILSVNSSLTAAQARRIIEKSCDKVGGYAYQSLSNQPNGTWSFELGYGKVNAYRAARLAQNNIFSSFSTPQQVFTATAATIPFTNLSENAVSYQWFFPGGTPSSSTAFQPTVTYQGLGNYDVTLIATSASGVKDTLYIAHYIKLVNNILMQNGSINTCNAVFYDAGGPNGSYLSGSNQTLTVNPAIAGNKVRVQFSSFNTESGYDFLSIYDGTSTSAPLLGAYSGSVLPPTITATNAAGALTFRFTSDGSSTANGWVAQMSCYQPVPMAFQSVTATHPTTAPVGIGTNNAQLLRISVTTTGELSPLNLTKFNLSTAGSTNATTDISGARLYYTGNSDVFATSNIFGTVTNPNGSFSVSGSRTLQMGLNYFWLVYDIKSSAVAGNLADAQVLSAVVADTNRTSTDGNPVGSRSIVNQVLMQNGSITTCSTNFYDEGGASGSYFNGTNQTLTINPAISGNRIRIQFSSFSTESCCDFLSIYDGTSTSAPLIGTFSGSVLPPTITATNAAGALTFRFTTDNSSTANGWAAQISCYQPVPMVFQNIIANHPTTSNVASGSNNNQILRVAVTTTGELSPLNLTKFNLSTAGSTNATTDIGGARVYYTGNSDVFATSNIFGAVVTNPNGTFSVGGSRTLLTGLNYFWLVYDIKSNATAGDVVDAQLLSATVADTNKTPSNGNPVGSRSIVNQVLMQNGSITTCNTNFYDEGGASSGYFNGLDQTLTINPAIAGNKIRVQFSSFSTESCCDYLRVYDGTNTNAPLLGAYSGSTLPPVVTATNATGALTFRFTTDGSGTANGWEAQVSCYQPVPMVFQSVTVNHPTTAEVGIGSSNNQLLRIIVHTSGELSPLNLTQFNLSTNGSTDAATDISEARLYYTGNSDVFATSNTFGASVANPNGTFSVNGNRTLLTGLNYFWLVYDIRSSAVEGNVVDAQLVSAVVAGTNITSSNGNPVGSRSIVNQVLMQNGSVTVCNTNFYDEGGASSNYLNGSSQTLTINPGIAGNKIRVQFSSFGTESCCDYLRVYDGTNTSAPLLGTYSGSVLPPTITATNASGALTFRFTSDGSGTGSGWAAQMSCFQPPPMVFQSITANHPTTAAVGIGSNNNQLLRITIQTNGEFNALNVTQFNLSTAGSTNAATDISGARLYATGNSDVFSTSNDFGTVVMNPNGTFSVNGNKTLQMGINYFWLVYDIKSDAVEGNVVDAQVLSAVVADTTRTATDGNPVGSRNIVNQVLMQNGSVTVCNTNFYDEGGASSNYLNGSNQALTINPAIAGNRIRVQFSSFNTETNSDVLRIYDGTSISAPLLGTYSGNTLPPTITATNVSGALTFRFTSNGSGTANGWAAQMSCYQPVPMVFQSVTANHPTTAAVGTGSNNNQLLRITVNTTGELSPLSLTQFNLSTNGSTNAATDISGARLYATGSTNVFSTSNAFGAVITNPNGTFSLSGSQALQKGLNYFWLVYDIKSDAVAGNVVDAQVLSATVADTNRTSTDGNPVGSRSIVNQVLMQNGSITTCSTNFYDEGGANDGYLNGRNQILTVNPAMAGNRIRVQFSSFSTESCCDFLRIYDGTSTSAPLIGTYAGSTLPPIITATNASGALTFRFSSDNSSTANGWAAQISCYQPVPMVFQNITVNHPTTAEVVTGSNNNQLLRIAMNTTGELNALSVTQFNLSTNGSTNAATDISGARLYATGSSNAFSTSNAFGTVITNPNGTFSVNGSRPLQMGINYFWLVYDIKNDAVAGNVVDAQLLSAVVADTNRTATNGNPAGSRTIANQVLMQNGSITTCNINFYDDGGADNNYSNNSSRILTVNPAIAGNRIRIQFSAFNVESGYDALRIYDGTSTSSPLIGTYAGSALPPTITATNAAGALTFRFTSSSAINYSGWSAQISCYQPVPMVFQSVTANHPTTAEIGIGSYNNQMLRIEVNTIGELSPLNLTQFNLSTAGSTNAATDISGARLYATGNSDVFLTNNAFGTAVANPNGTFSVNGNTVLQTGINYFWLVYDIKSGAVAGNVVDAQLLSTVVANTNRTPTDGNPAGARTINNQVLMQNSSVTVCNASFYDEGGVSDNYLNASSKTLTINPASTGNKVRVQFSSFSTESCCDLLRIYDGTSTNAPLIGTYAGSTLPPTITATNATGALTFRFTSNNSIVAGGWAAQISCCPLITRPTITVAGNPNLCMGDSVLLTAPAGYNYLWSNGATSRSIVVRTAGSYSVQTSAGDCISEPSSVVQVQVQVLDIPNLLNNVVLNAAPDTAVSVGQNVTLSFATELNLKITEITLYRGGTGMSLPYPNWIPGGAEDFVEITNVGSSTVQLSSNLSLQVYTGSSAFINYPLPNISLSAGDVAVIHLGTGIDNPAQKYFNTGTTNDVFSSSSLAGFVLKNNRMQRIVDAVAINNYVFPASSGVTSADWSGSIVELLGLAGASLRGLDNNNASGWIRNSALIPQNIGNLNKYILLNNMNIKWVGPNGFKETGDIVNTGTFKTAGTYMFTASLSIGNCSPTTSIKIHVTVPEHDILVRPNPNRGNFTVLGKDVQSLEMFDAQGRLVYQKMEPQANSEPISVQLHDVAQGVYFLKIFTKSSVVTKRLIIQ